MIRDRILDTWELIVGVLRAVLASISWEAVQLPRADETAEYLLAVLVGGGFAVLILHGIYDLSRFFW